MDSEIKRMDSEVSVLNDSISSKNTRIASIEQQKFGVSSNADLAKEVGPLKYIAKLTGSNIDSVVNWYIIVLMFVFDPLAIALVIAANFAFEMNDKENKKEEEKVEEKENKIKKFWKNITSRKNKSSDSNNEEPIEINNVEEEEIAIKADLDNIEEINEPIQDIIKMEEDPLVDQINETAETEIKNDVVEDSKKEENKEENPDKYINNPSQQNKVKSVRDKFRGNPDIKSSREGLRNNNWGNEDPLNLR